MVWFSSREGAFAMLTVRSAATGGFDLLRVSARSTRVLGRFERCEDAIRRWNEMERELRELSRISLEHRSEMTREKAGPTGTC